MKEEPKLTPKSVLVGCSSAIAALMLGLGLMWVASTPAMEPFVGDNTSLVNDTSHDDAYEVSSFEQARPTPKDVNSYPPGTVVATDISTYRRQVFVPREPCDFGYHRRNFGPGAAGCVAAPKIRVGPTRSLRGAACALGDCQQSGKLCLLQPFKRGGSRFILPAKIGYGDVMQGGFARRC